MAGPAWLLAGVVALTVAEGAAAASAAQCSSAAYRIDPAKVSFTGVYLGQAMVAVAGVLTIGNEYSTRMIKPSLAGVPWRLTWLFATAAMLTGPGSPPQYAAPRRACPEIPRCMTPYHRSARERHRPGRSRIRP